jgi:phosphopantetheinyl transferase
MTADCAELLLLHAARRPAGGVPPAWHGRLREALPYAKRLEIERREPGERAASLDALALLCVALDRAGDAGVRLRDLRYDEHGAPRLRQGRGFSVAHAASAIACVVAVSPADLALGLDLEDIDAATRADAARCARLRDWVAIEAVLKAAGRGLRESGAVAMEVEEGAATAGSCAEACRFAVLHGVRHRVVEPALGPSLVCALACRDSVHAQPRIESLDLDAPAVSAAVERRLGLPA